MTVTVSWVASALDGHVTLLSSSRIPITGLTTAFFCVIQTFYHIKNYSERKMIVYYERMKLQKHATILILFLIILAHVSPAFAQLTPIQFSQAELDQFQTEGYSIRKHLPYEEYNRLVFGRIQPLYAEFNNKVTFEAHNDVEGRFSVFVNQSEPIQSIDGQRILDIDCCENLYKSEIEVKNLQFGDTLKKSFLLPKLEKTYESGTYNSKINILVFPDY